MAIRGLLVWGVISGGSCLSFPAGPAAAQTEVQQLYQAAQQARARGDLPQAEQKYLEVIRQAPQLANAHHNLGIVYFLERKYTDAVTALEKAVQLGPRLAGAHSMLGLAHYELYEPEKAALAFQEALLLNPADANALLYLGKAQLQMRDYRAAAQTLEKLSQSKPADPDVLYALSLSYMKLMLEGVNRLGAAAPRSYQFSLLLAQDSEARGYDEEAIKKYQEALAFDGKYDAAGIHYAIGSAYARMGKFDEATGELQKELELNPNDPLALWKLGELAFRTDPQQARGYLERSVSLNPGIPQAVLAYGRALAKTGETEKAVEQFRRVVRLAPEEHSVHYHLFKAYRQLGKLEDAKVELARFQEMAARRLERVQQTARQMMHAGRADQEPSDEPEPGFSPSREPTHH